MWLVDPYDHEFVYTTTMTVGGIYNLIFSN